MIHVTYTNESCHTYFAHVCSVLQCVAVCCSVLSCVAVCCSVLPCVASALQCVFVHQTSHVTQISHTYALQLHMHVIHINESWLHGRVLYTVIYICIYTYIFTHVCATITHVCHVYRSITCVNVSCHSYKRVMAHINESWLHRRVHVMYVFHTHIRYTHAYVSHHTHTHYTHTHTHTHTHTYMSYIYLAHIRGDMSRHTHV